MVALNVTRPAYMRVMIRFAAILLVFSVGAAQAAPEKILRYVSQRPDQAYLREGPSFGHKVLWVYRHRGYPFAVTAEFDWRRVRRRRHLGWMSAMLSDQRTVLVSGRGRVKITAEPMAARWRRSIPAPLRD